MIAGIDIGIAKPSVICLMSEAGRITKFIHAEGSAGEVLACVPEDVSLIAWEEAYHKHNVKVTKQLAGFGRHQRPVLCRRLSENQRGGEQRQQVHFQCWLTSEFVARRLILV